MGRLIAALLLILLAAPVHAQVVKDWQWVGNTSTSMPYTSGMGAVAAQCQADHQAGARLCLSSEVVRTPVPPIVPSSGWLFDDLAPNAAALLPACTFRGTTAGEAVRVTPDGVLERVPCSGGAPAACCQMQVVPEPGASLQGLTALAALYLLARSPRAS